MGELSKAHVIWVEWDDANDPSDHELDQRHVFVNQDRWSEAVQFAKKLVADGNTFHGACHVTLLGPEVEPDYRETLRKVEVSDVVQEIEGPW